MASFHLTALQVMPAHLSRADLPSFVWRKTWPKLSSKPTLNCPAPITAVQQVPCTKHLHSNLMSEASSLAITGASSSWILEAKVSASEGAYAGLAVLSVALEADKDAVGVDCKHFGGDTRVAHPACSLLRRHNAPLHQLQDRARDFSAHAALQPMTSKEHTLQLSQGEVSCLTTCTKAAQSLEPYCVW